MLGEKKKKKKFFDEVCAFYVWYDFGFLSEDK